MIFGEEDRLNIPEEIQQFRDTIRERRDSRFNRLMEQHNRMKKEERIRLLIDILAILAALAGALALLGVIFHHDHEKESR